MIFGELKFTQIGHLAEPPSFRVNPDGSKVANFRLITNVGWKDKASGEYKGRAEGFNFELWGEGAEYLRNLPTGAQLYVVAEPYNHNYKDQGGVERWTIRFRVTTWRRLDRKPAAGAPDPAAGGDGKASDDDVPF